MKAPLYIHGERLFDQAWRRWIKEFFGRELFRAEALSVAILKEALEHVTIRLQPISPGIARKIFRSSSR